MSIVNGNYDLLKKGLDALWLRQKVISGNIANISTPGFTASEVEFEDLFLDILQSGEERKTINRLVSELEPVIVEDQTVWSTEGTMWILTGRGGNGAPARLSNSNKADCR